NGGVTVDANLQSAIESVMATDAIHILLDLIRICVRAKNRAGWCPECLIEPIAEADARLCMVAGREEWRASDISQGRRRNKMWTEPAHILHCRIALMIEELHSKTAIDRSLIGVGHRPSHLVQAESGKQLRLLRKAMVPPD